MSSKTLNDLIEQARSLTIEEQLRLAASLVQQAIDTYPPHNLQLTQRRRSRRKWREIRGLARPSLLGQDAQSWVSRTRREAK